MKIKKKTRKIKLIKLNDSNELEVVLGDTLYKGREITSEEDLKNIVESAKPKPVNLLYSADDEINWSDPKDEKPISTAYIYIGEGDEVPTFRITGNGSIPMSYEDIMDHGLFLITSSEFTGPKNKGVDVVYQSVIKKEIKETGGKKAHELMSEAAKRGDSEGVKRTKDFLTEKGFASVSKSALSEYVKQVKDKYKEDYYKLLKVNEESKDLFLSMSPRERKFFINFLSKEDLSPWKKYYKALNPDTPMNQNTIYNATRGDGNFSNSNTLGAIDPIIDKYEDEVKDDDSYSMAYRLLEKSDRGVPYMMLVELLLGEKVNEASIIPYKLVNQKYLDSIGATGKGTIRVDRLVSEKLKSGEWVLSTKSDLTGRRDLELVLKLEGGNIATVTSEQTSFLNSELIEYNFDISEIVKAEEESRTGGLALTHFDTFEEDIRFYFKLILEEEAVIKFIVEDLKGTDGITVDIKRVIVETVDKTVEGKVVVDYTDYLVNADYNRPAFQKLYKTMMFYKKED